MLKVGITGGMGSGKSTICAIFESLKIPVYYSDDRAKALMISPKIKSKIQEYFGKNIYKDNNELDRKLLAEIVFNDKSKLDKLNSIVHPAVFEDFRKWVKTHQNYPYIIKEAALMFESKSYKELDFVVNVNAPIEVRIKRILERDKSSRKQILERINKQFTDKKRSELANYTIINNGKKLLIPQILKLHEILIQINN